MPESTTREAYATHRADFRNYVGGSQPGRDVGTLNVQVASCALIDAAKATCTDSEFHTRMGYSKLRR